MHPICDIVRVDALRECMESGDMVKMRLMLISQEYLLDIDEHEQLLLFAEQTSKITMIKLLLEYDPRYTEEFKDKTLSALWIAVLYDHRNSAELLVRSGYVNLNKPLGVEFREIYDGESRVLHALLRMSNPFWSERFFALVVDRGADLEARDSRGRTPLHYAVAQDRVQVTELLLEKGADVNARDNEGDTALLMAVQSEKADEFLPLLMRYEADVTVKDAKGCNALYHLTNSPGERVDLARFLIKKGALLNDCRDQPVGNITRPLHIALCHRKYELAKLYLNRGAALNDGDSLGRTILHCAAEENDVQMIEWLLEKGADINVADNNGETPLLVAAKSHIADELLPLLIKHGADVTAADSRGKNALDLLTFAPLRCERERKDLAILLIKKGLSPNDRLAPSSPILAAICSNRDNLVNLYLDHGVDVNSSFADGHSLLHLATNHTMPVVLETLLKRGANVDSRTDKGRTALHFACQKSRLYAVGVLLQAGANILVEDQGGKTPFALIEEKGIKNPVMKLMLLKLALKKASQPSIELKDERIIEVHPELRGYYQDCFAEIDKMKSMRLTDTCCVFDLFTKSVVEIFMLMKNNQLRSNFKHHDLDLLRNLQIYNAKHVLLSFERAERQQTAHN